MMNRSLMKKPETVERTSGDELLNEVSTVQDCGRKPPKAINGSDCYDGTSFAGGNFDRSCLAVARWNAPG